MSKELLNFKTKLVHSPGPNIHVVGNIGYDVQCGVCNHTMSKVAISDCFCLEIFYLH